MEKATKAVETFCNKYYPSFIRGNVINFYDNKATIMRMYPGEIPLSGNLSYMKENLVLPNSIKVSVLSAVCTEDDIDEDTFIAYVFSKVQVNEQNEFFMNHTVFFSQNGAFIKITKDVINISNFETLKEAEPVLEFTQKNRNKNKSTFPKEKKQIIEDKPNSTQKAEERMKVYRPTQRHEQSNKFEDYKPDSKNQKTQNQEIKPENKPEIKPERKPAPKPNPFKEYIPHDEENKPIKKQDNKNQGKQEKKQPREDKFSEYIGPANK